MRSSENTIRISLVECQSKCGIINEFDYFDSEKCMAVNEICSKKDHIQSSSDDTVWTLLMDKVEIQIERAHWNISVCINEGYRWFGIDTHIPW